MIKALIGAALVLWALKAGIGTYESNRAEVFQGPVGFFVCLLVLLIGAGLVISAFF